MELEMYRKPQIQLKTEDQTPIENICHGFRGVYNNISAATSFQACSRQSVLAHNVQLSEFTLALLGSLNCSTGIKDLEARSQKRVCLKLCSPLSLNPKVILPPSFFPQRWQKEFHLEARPFLWRNRLLPNDVIYKKSVSKNRAPKNEEATEWL